MDNSETQTTKKSAFKTLVPVITLLFLALTVYIAVLAVNAVKRNAYIGQDVVSRNTIIVSDTGEIYTKPDLGLISFSVVTDAKAVADAMSENTQKMNAVIDSVKSKGVDPKDLQTTNFSISPTYSDSSAVCMLTYCPPVNRILTGYEVTQTLQVKIRALDKTGDIIQGATNAGSNQTGDLQFTVDNQDQFLSQARAQAIDKAKAKAGELANQLGVKLVRIVGFNENGSVPAPIYAMDAKAAEATGTGGATAQIETGQNKITSTVSITYEIR